MKKFYLVFSLQIFIALFVLNTVCMGNGLLKINVQSFSLVESHNVRLGDIARITGDEPDVVKAVQSIVIASAPVKDRSLIIGKSLIKRRLSKNGFDLKKVKFAFPDKITVKNKLTRISEDEVKEAIREHIYENMPWNKEQVDITKIAYKGDIVLPDGEIQLKIITNENSSFIGKVSLDLELKVNGKMFKHRKVKANIRVLMPIVLTRVSFKKGHIISDNDIFVDRQWKSKVLLKNFTSKDEVIGKKATRNIKAGQPLMESFLKIPDDILRGDRVMILAETKTLKVTSPGIAGESGKKGETIRVKNIDSKKIIYARVIDSTTVKVDF